MHSHFQCFCSGHETIETPIERASMALALGLSAPFALQEVQKLQEGEIVEQVMPGAALLFSGEPAKKQSEVAPAFTTENGIVRVQIRHPSSPLFPKPIGWVTQDASAAGGPTFLEPGPEPMKMQGAAPAAPGAPGWRPSPWRPRVPPPRPFGRPSSFQNISWTPG
ncbi:Calcium-dependent protein kinase 2 [Durusdinium trenchii]|uniref:Calcium-dependent protein kinase 2 n=1 Tax=Durusdinium trenchii TaxID=1381693 RepID=A0ABP0QCU6_9DINO